METSFTVEPEGTVATKRPRLKSGTRGNKKLCCLAQGVTLGILVKVIIDVVFTLVDMVFDIYLTKTLFRSHHYKWGTASILVIFLPGITCTVGRCIQDNTFKEGNRHWIQNFSWIGVAKILFNLFCYPLWLIVLAYRVLCSKPDVRIMVHVKAWEGLMESSWQFLIQIVFFQFRTPIGHTTVFGFHLDHGEFWFRVFGIILSFSAFLYTVTEYHVLLDGMVAQPRRQIKLAPFLIVNFLFRSLTLSLCWVYWQEYAVFVNLLLWIVNMYLTRKTLTSDFTGRNYKHITFSWIAGGVISQLTPVLALFYGQTANKKTINYFYKKNIRINNTLLLLIFSVLVLQLNLDPENPRILNRNVLLGCHKNGTPYTMEEFAFSGSFKEEFLEVNETTGYTDFPFKDWKFRYATSSEYVAENSDATTTTITTTTPTPPTTITTTATTTMTTTTSSTTTTTTTTTNTTTISTIATKTNTTITKNTKITTTKTTTITNKTNYTTTTNRNSNANTIRTSTKTTGTTTTRAIIDTNITTLIMAKNRATNDYSNKYLIAPDCKDGQSSVKWFNMLAVPVIYLLGLASTLTSWCKFEMK